MSAAFGGNDSRQKMRFCEDCRLFLKYEFTDSLIVVEGSLQGLSVPADGILVHSFCLSIPSFSLAYSLALLLK
ncbi:hypothetical protein O181_019252 [Austropuccinia psidii MF-1]|uniref:Uncharacterized protein n=1 Tax=Austropuccinia psidii MF-1 TaxID=1389203 RepID=A0A9Q3CB64_9BASI|nr:hypothetical protein [Austropuccinia psidii MF-1]